MLRSIVLMFLAVCLVDSAAAQVSAAPQAGQTDLVLHDGQPVVMRALQRATSSDATVGQKIQFEVIKPVNVGDLVVIPEGAVATAKVVDVEKPRRMGRGGKLSISIEHVQLSDGQLAPLRTVIARRAGGKGEMAGAMVGTFAATYGLSLPLTPFFLLKHGDDMAVSPGDRFRAFVDGDVPLNPDTLLAAQAAITEQRNTGTIYVFRDLWDNGNLPQVPVTCGDAFVGSFHQDQFVRLEVPPGTYWFLAGDATFKKKQRLRRKDYLSLQVEAGSTHYLRLRSVRTGMWKGVGWDAHLESLDAHAGAAAFTEINYKAEHALEIAPQELDKLQVQAPPDPETKPSAGVR